jgi:hypothetical protein
MLFVQHDPYDVTETERVARAMRRFLKEANRVYGTTRLAVSQAISKGECALLLTVDDFPQSVRLTREELEKLLGVMICGFKDDAACDVYCDRLRRLLPDYDEWGQYVALDPPQGGFTSGGPLN